MRQILIVLLISSFFIGCSCQKGERYQVTGDKIKVMVDTKTGKSWLLKAKQDKMGLWFERVEVEGLWEKAGKE